MDAYSYTVFFNVEEQKVASEFLQLTSLPLFPSLFQNHIKIDITSI